MKLKYIIPSFIALLATLVVGCSEDDDKTYLDGLRVSQSYVSLDVNGGSTSITITANADWSFENQQWIEKKDTTNAPAPKWLKVTPASGGAGETTITFSAESTIDGRSASLKIVSGDKEQIINIIQGTTTISEATCAEVIAGPDSKTYRVKGTVKSIANTTYGNWYLADETGEIYIYGTLDAKGATKNFTSLGLEVGDIVTVEGPKTTYNGTVELVDVTVVKIEKSLIKVDSLSIADGMIEKEGGDIIAYVTCKGNGIGVDIPQEAQSWLGITGITGNTVTFHAAANAGGDRSTTITFNTTDGKKKYTSEVTIGQKGAIIDVTVAEFLAAEEGDTQYRVTGIITKVAKAEYGNVYVRDHSGEVYVYGIGAKGDFEAAGLKEGDIVTLVGKRASYNDTPQMKGGALESFIAVEPATIPEFVAKEDSKDKYYMISGTVRAATDDEVAGGAKNDIEKYGNFYLEDENGASVYIYGVTKGWGGAKGEFGDLGVGYGDKLTIVAYKTTYAAKNLIQGVGMYFSHVPANN